MSQENNSAVDVAILKERVANLQELHSDVKKVLETVQKIELQLAVRPTFAHLAPLKKDIQGLKDDRLFLLGGKKALVLVGGVAASVITFVFNAVPAVWHWLTSSPHNPSP